MTETVSFSPVKTNLKDARTKPPGMPTYSAASGEADIYLSNCEMLRAAGASLPDAPTAVRGGSARGMRSNARPFQPHAAAAPLPPVRPHCNGCTRARRPPPQSPSPTARAWWSTRPSA